MDVVTVRVDEKTRKELDQVVEELGGSTSEVIRKAIHLAWFTTMQDRMRRERSRSASGPVTLLGKGSIYLLTMPAHTGDHTKKDAATRSS
jgi:Arc/MetJ-type ribon-helix-helix transcriptional regulator